MNANAASADDVATASLVEKYLACPQCHRAVTVSADIISCTSCQFTGRLKGNVAVVMQDNALSFFDDKFAVMEESQLSRGGAWALCCERQVALLEKHLAPGQVVLDVGCGPRLPYTPPGDSFVIGLEPSFPSVRANRQVNLRVCGTATEMPLPSRSVDIAVAFYSIHHMVGQTTRDNRDIVAKAFAELNRVLKPGGSLFVFEMTPYRPVYGLQRFAWNLAKRLLGGRLDMYFRSAESMAAFGAAAMSAAQLEEIDFPCSAFETFPPFFSVPWFRIPKILYPLDARLYKWKQPGPPGQDPALRETSSGKAGLDEA
jgi:SAM-dependent methyltransferase